MKSGCKIKTATSKISCQYDNVRQCLEGRAGSQDIAKADVKVTRAITSKIGTLWDVIWPQATPLVSGEGLGVH